MGGKKHEKKKPESHASTHEPDDRDDNDEGFEDDDDELDDDEDDYEPGIDDHETLRVERERMEHADGRQWHEISSTLSSITYAMPISQRPADLPPLGAPPAPAKLLGTAMLVKSWGPDGEPMQSMIWMPSVDLSDVVTEPVDPE